MIDFWRPVRTSTTFGTAFDPRNNSLNVLRVALAVAVVVSHAWPTGGFGHDPQLHGEGIGRWAVAGFFAISGFLVTGSREQLGLAEYLRRRAARILPGFWACLVVTAFVVAPAAAWFAGRAYRIDSAVGYVLRNSALVILQPDINDPLPVPYLEGWNGSLWTLKWEFFAYLGVGVLFCLRRTHRLPTVVVSVLAALVAAHAALQLWGSAPTLLLDALWLLTSFAAGVALHLFRDRVPVHGGVAGLAVLALALSAATGTLSVFGPVPLAYLVLWLAVALPTPLQRAFRRNDISYGMYVYGFVVQQCLALGGVPRFGVAVFAVVGVVATVPLALASWVLVERPAKRRFARAPRPAPAASTR